MVRTAASLEHLDSTDKTVFGNWIATRLRSPQNAAGPWAWALGRIGARVAKLCAAFGMLLLAASLYYLLPREEAQNPGPYKKVLRSVFRLIGGRTRCAGGGAG